MTGPAEDAPGGRQERLDEPRCRATVQVLEEYAEPLTLPDLAEEVAIREHEAPITAVPGRAVRDVYLSLYHTYIPALTAAGMVEYDQETDVVRPATESNLERNGSPEDGANR